MPLFYYKHRKYIQYGSFEPFRPYDSLLGESHMGDLDTEKPRQGGVFPIPVRLD